MVQRTTEVKKKEGGALVGTLHESLGSALRSENKAGK